MAEKVEKAAGSRPEPAGGSANVGTPGRATRTSALSPGKLRLPQPLEVGLGPVAGTVPKKLEPMNGPLFEQENRVKADYEKLKAGRYDIAKADDYVARVNHTFGSLREYLDWAPRSDQILAPVKHMVELHGDEQKVFFRWVSRLYHSTLSLSDQQIIDLIRKGIDPRMASAVKGAEDELGEKIHYQGSNPRPMKNDKGKYRLGTLSQHASGTAIDIDPAHNPILSGKAWTRIVRSVSATADLGLAKWTTDPGGYYEAIADVNAKWATLVEATVAARRWERSHPGALQGDKLKPPAGAVPRLELRRPEMLVDPHHERLEAVKHLLGADADLAKHVKVLAELPGFHFMRHSRELVMALRNQGLQWGATFFPDNVDLHHFQLPTTPLPAVGGDDEAED